LPEPVFEKSVFINCPLDEEFEPILQAILFCILSLGFHPRLATEQNDSAEIRIEKIRKLIEASKYSIHDLSRSIATAIGQHFRLNMPFELGIDYACRQYFGHGREGKRLLIMEATKYSHMQSISDLSGCDFESHEGKFEVAIRKVRNWLVNEASAPRTAPSKIIGDYYDFQEWHYERQLGEGFSEEDIKDYPTSELMTSMAEWLKLGKPI